jgi:hypothetical protein
MESLWCMEKNKIQNLMDNPGKNNWALVPCKGPACEKWENGECFYIRRAGR